MVSIYQSSPDPRPDSDYEPGALRHLVAGNRGRLLDARRTPVSVIEVQPTVGFVHIRIEGFEDEGAVWLIPLEQADHYQWEPQGPRASEADVTEMKQAIERFDRVLVIEPDESARSATEARIDVRRTETSSWLAEHSRFLAAGEPLPDPATRRGHPLLAADLEAYMRWADLWDVEEALTATYVSNPGSGELVKGHRIVIAELGLADYRGTIVRDPATFAEPWTRDRRAAHIVARLAFLRALLGRLGNRKVTLWRGFSTDGRMRRPAGRTFVSTSFSEAVARSHYQGGAQTTTRGLVWRAVPVERLLMTYHETAAMNTMFLEAEAVVLDHRDDRWP